MFSTCVSILYNTFNSVCIHVDTIFRAGFFGGIVWVPVVSGVWGNGSVLRASLGMKEEE